MTEQIVVGRHVLQFEEQDLMIIRLQGPFFPGEMRKIAQVLDTRLIELRRLFILVDLRQAEPPSYASRQELKGRPKSILPHWIAHLGVRREFAVVLDLVSRATSILTGGKSVSKNFQDEPSARAWLTEMRVKYLSNA